MSRRRPARSTAASGRCRALWLIVRWEERRWGQRPLRARYFAWLAGAFFAADLVLWHNAIDQVGAGLATVLGNTQVVLVGLIAWLIWRERPTTSSLIAIPVVLVRRDPHLRRARARRLRQEPGARRGLRRPHRARVHRFLLALRQGGRGIVGPAGPLFDATLASAIGCAIIGLAVGDLDLTPSLAAQGWLSCSRSARRCSAGC